MQQQHCHFCGHLVLLVHVHGHYQCPVCHTNALPCFDGDNCDTNQLLAEKPQLRQEEPVKQKQSHVSYR